jgi:hypothetical protein
MKAFAKNWRYFSAGLYAWIVTTFLGAILLDIVYSRAASSALEPTETTVLFSSAADFLLLIGALAFLAGIGAIGASWSSGSARNLFIASFLFLMAEFLAPMLLFPLLQKLQAALGINPGMWIRLMGGELSSVLAFIGLWKLHPSTS